MRTSFPQGAIVDTSVPFSIYAHLFLHIVVFMQRITLDRSWRDGFGKLF